ncbi:hypothetical protein [Paenibacillus ginsengarvi]|nr:hypothetical protein [Paenibacillus ginsengarvi]
MKEEDIIALIQKEVKENPQVRSIEITKKHRIPFAVVEMFRRKLAETS